MTPSRNTAATGWWHLHQDIAVWGVCCHDVAWDASIPPQDNSGREGETVESGVLHPRANKPPEQETEVAQ